MLRQLTAVLVVLITAVCMAGCQEAKADTNTEKSAQVIGAELTFDDVNNIEVNGVKVSLPFKAEDLGEGFFIGEVQGFDEKEPALFFNDACVALVELDDDLNIVTAIFDYDEAVPFSIKVNGISFKNNFSQIIDAMGTPDKEKELALIYEYDGGKIYIGSSDGSSGCDYINISLYSYNSDTDGGIS